MRIFATKSNEEIKAIVNRGHISMGNGVLVFSCWSIAATKIPPEAVVGPRWIKVWGVPLSEWYLDNFKGIGGLCRGMLELDPRSANREVMSANRMKVGVIRLAEIPRAIDWMINGERFVFLIEVEAALHKVPEDGQLGKTLPSEGGSDYHCGL